MVDERNPANEKEDPGSATRGAKAGAADRPARPTGPSHSERPEQERSAAEQENTIRPRKIRKHARASEAGQDPRSEPTLAPPPSNPKPSTPTSGEPDTDPWTVPASVRQRFHQVGHRFHFPDGELAFRDHGRKLVSPSENVEVIASLIEIAQARGWTEISVTGTEAFRQETWRQARLQGLAVRGYRPSEEQRVALKVALERKQEREGQKPAAAAPGTTAASNGAAEPADRVDRDRARRQVIRGKLADHGREHYQFNPQEEMSYFVRIETPQGKHLIWGKDLQRAIEKSLSHVKIGDEVAVQRTGADKVTVKRRERNAQGQVLKEMDVAAQRNRWVIETREFLEARESAAQAVRDPVITARSAVKSHPELAGTYLNLHAAEIASRRLRHPEDQKKFVALVRGTLADAVARGEPLEPVRLRERVSRRAPPVREAREPEGPTL